MCQPACAVDSMHAHHVVTAGNSGFQQKISVALACIVMGAAIMHIYTSMYIAMHAIFLVAILLVAIWQ